jgi:hypothetical protein
MRGQALIAWAQCRETFGMLRDFVGWADQGLGQTLEQAVEEAVKWSDDTKTVLKEMSENIDNAIMTVTNSGTASGEHVPRPWLSGAMSQSQQWGKLITVTGLVNVYGISISAFPDPATPPIPPLDAIPVVGSIVLHTATFNPGPLYQLSDFLSPRFDFTSTMFFGWNDKPVTPMAVPWEFDLDSNCVPAQWETETWNVNIPIAKHMIPATGLSVWGYWNSLSQPRLKVKLITAPINQ